MLNVGRIVNGGCVSDLSAEVIAAYDAPFPDESFKAGARQFPLLVPITPEDPAPSCKPGRLGIVAPLRSAVSMRLLPTQIPSPAAPMRCSARNL